MRAINDNRRLLCEMQSIIAQIYGGERSKIRVAKFYEEKEVAVKAHNEFEDKLIEEFQKIF